MRYLALYRKYRPISFSSLVGQEEIKKILLTEVKMKTITHAYLFSGPRGTGKTTTAKILAKMVNCENLKDDSPCGKCKSCLNLFNNNDVIEIDAASNNGVDEIRNLREKATLVPSFCKYKVYIIDEIHMLTTQAFNALLKILEEPPKHVIFILATTEYHKIPLTILSRCQKFQFHKLTIEEIFKKLREIADLEKIEITDEALNEIAKIADGSMRDSINFLDQMRSFKFNDKINVSDVYEVCGSFPLEKICNLFEDISLNDIEKVLSFFEELEKDGKNFNKFFDDAMSFLKDVILYKKNVSKSYIQGNIDYVSKIASIYTEEQIFYFIDEINLLVDRIKNVSRQKIYVVTKILSMMEKINNNGESLIKQDKAKIESKEGLEENLEKYDLAFNFNGSQIDKENMKEDKKQETQKKDVKIDEENKETFKNKEKIINNTFAVASKEIKKILEEKFKNIGKYLTMKKYGNIASLITDMTIQVGGEGYVIFTVKYDALIEKIYQSYKECNKFIDMLFDGNYHFAVITLEEWKKYREEYIENKKEGKEYKLLDLDEKEVKEEKTIIKKEEKKTTVVDKLFDLVGEDTIEIK